jgi:hypothetical protein
MWKMTVVMMMMAMMRHLEWNPLVAMKMTMMGHRRHALRLERLLQPERWSMMTMT